MFRRRYLRFASRRPSASRAGFSILEALVVLFVLGLVAALGIPAFLTQMGKVRLESTATDIANLMSQTRLRAIRDSADYTVEISGGSVVGMGFLGSSEASVDFNNPPIAIYNDTGTAICRDTYDGSGTLFDNNSVTYQSDGTATGSGAICIHDGKGNVLQVVVQSVNSPPRIRKFLAAGDAPSGNAGFYEKTTFNAETGEANIWVWN